MMKRIAILITALVAIAGISAFGYIGRTATDTSTKTDSTRLNWADFGISGGLIINKYTGKVSQVLPAKTNLVYIVRGKYGSSMMTEPFRHATTVQELKKARFISDVITDYPFNWITDYRSVEVLTRSNGKEIREVGSNNSLTSGQKDLFNSVDINSYVIITVGYKTKNAVTGKDEDREMKVGIGVVPETKAAYDGGYDKMISYLKENTINEIVAQNLNYLPQPSISFVVNENGETENVKLVKTSGNDEIDKLLVKVIELMPKWKPAKNAKGLPVKQEFVLDIADEGC